MNKIIDFVLLLFNGIGIIFSQENYLPSTTPYLPGEKTDEFFKYYTISKLKVNKYILDSEIDDYAHTPNLFDLSKPIPNPGKGVIDYIFDNYISVDICGHKIIDILNEDVYKYFNLTETAFLWAINSSASAIISMVFPIFMMPFLVMF